MKWSHVGARIGSALVKIPSFIDSTYHKPLLLGVAFLDQVHGAVRSDELKFE